MKKIGIVICNFNKVDKVLECIQCILENKFTDYDLYVVDNASTDGAPDAIKEKYGDKVKINVNKEKHGGSGGFNTGLLTVINIIKFRTSDPLIGTVIIICRKFL